MHFKRGDSFEPSAKWLNDLDAMLGEWKRRQRGGGGGPAEPYNGDLIRVRNTTGESRGRFAVLGLDEPPFELDEENGTLATFQRSPVMDGIEPAFPAHVGRYAVMLEPTANNEIGVGLVGGCVVVRLQAIWNSDKWAEIYEVGDSDDDEEGRDDPYRLVSRDFGSAEILWREPDGEGDVDGEPRDKWALIRVGTRSIKRTFSIKSDMTAYMMRNTDALTPGYTATETEFTLTDPLGTFDEAQGEDETYYGEFGRAEMDYTTGAWEIVQRACVGQRTEKPE
jgi:hypothetical protein